MRRKLRRLKKNQRERKMSSENVDPLFYFFRIITLEMSFS